MPATGLEPHVLRAAAVTGRGVRGPKGRGFEDGAGVVVATGRKVVVAGLGEEGCCLGAGICFPPEGLRFPPGLRCRCLLSREDEDDEPHK
jgi:hypothetical protein